MGGFALSGEKEYERYIKQCEMLGIKDFVFNRYMGSMDWGVRLVKYIPNEESDRRIVIPDFVTNIHWTAFKGVKQNLKVKWKNNKSGSLFGMFSGYMGEELDLSEMDVSRVIIMSNMFEDCIELKRISLNGWDTSRVASMANMFMNCCSLKELDLSILDTRSVTNMDNMFADCRELEKLDITGFDRQKIEESIGTFYLCDKLKLLM